MKKVIVLAAAAVAIAALLSSGTLAYFVAQGKADNVITSGNIRIELHDETADGNTFPRKGINGIVPGSVVGKVVYVKNVGDNPLFARIKLEKLISTSRKKRVSDAQGIILNINEKDWTYSQEQGCYYYSRALEPGEKTPPLFTTVTFSTEMGNEYQNARIDINISAQAVQSQNNTDSPLAAAGWPAE